MARPREVFIVGTNPEGVAATIAGTQRRHVQLIIVRIEKTQQPWGWARRAVYPEIPEYGNLGLRDAIPWGFPASPLCSCRHPLRRFIWVGLTVAAVSTLSTGSRTHPLCEEATRRHPLRGFKRKN